MRRRWVWIALVASLALNLFLGGLMIGRIALERAGPVGGLSRVLSPVSPWALGRSLSHERRDELRDLVLPQMREVRREFDGLLGQREALISALIADPYDAEAMARALAGMQSSLQSVHGELNEVILRVATELTPEERRKLAEAIERRDWREERRKRWWTRHHEDHDDDDG